MTSDKIKSAMIAYLGTKIDLPVVDAESFDEVELPCVAVKISQVERMSLALAKVESITMQVVYRAHSGDDTRETSLMIADTIAAELIEPATIKAAINASIEDGVVVDFLQFAGGSPEWDEATFECTWEGECYAQRGTIA